MTTGTLSRIRPMETWGGDAVPWDSPDRCSITWPRPEQLMRCVCKQGHSGNHRFGNLRESGKMVKS